MLSFYSLLKMLNRKLKGNLNLKIINTMVLDKLKLTIL